MTEVTIEATQCCARPVPTRRLLANITSRDQHYRSVEGGSVVRSPSLDK